MMGADVPRRSARRLRDAANPLVSLRSPLPLIVAGIGAALLLIAAVTLPPRPAAAPQPETLSTQEALTLVAQQMRSGEAALRVVNQGQVRFDNGTWFIRAGEAEFHFSQRNRIVVADNDAAKALANRDPGPQ